MNDSDFEDVDDLLAAWAVANEPTTPHLAKLERNIERALRKDGDTAIGPTLSQQSWNEKRSMLLAIVAAVIVIAASAAFWLNRPNVQDETRRTAGLVEGVPIEVIDAQQREDKQQLLAELDRMFDGKRVWFVETETDVVLGGDAKSTASDIVDSTALAMRIVLAKRSPAHKAWIQVWTADVVSRTDQVVRFMARSDKQASATVTAWAHLLPDGIVACDIDLKWENGVTGRLADSLLLSPDIAEQGSTLTLNGIEYRLFHTVSLLDQA